MTAAVSTCVPSEYCGCKQTVRRAIRLLLILILVVALLQIQEIPSAVLHEFRRIILRARAKVSKRNKALPGGVYRTKMVLRMGFQFKFIFES